MKFALLPFCFNIMFFCQAQQLYKDSLYTNSDKEFAISAGNMTTNPDKKFYEREIFDANVDIEAEYLEGLPALRKYVAEQADGIGLYPKKAQQEKKEGRVIVRFVVDKDGSVGNFTVLRDDVGYGASKKLIDILKTTEKWKPAQSSGKPVRSYYRFSVLFKLPSEENTEESTEE